MIINGCNITKDITEKADVCVIGTGSGGAVMAAELAQAGLKTVVLESGGFYTAKDFNQREADMDVKLQGKASSSDGAVTLFFCNSMGGSTVHYTGMTLRAPSHVFTRWEKEYGVQGLNDDILQPYYEKVEKIQSISMPTEHMHNKANLYLKKGSDALGWWCDAVPSCRLNCLNCGFCTQGCAGNRKQSMLITYIPMASRAGAKIYADCRGERVLHKNGRVTGVQATLLNRYNKSVQHKLTVDAKIVIVSAGAFNTPVILLKSGLPNTSGKIGQDLRMCPQTQVYGLFEEKILQHRGMPHTYIVREWLDPRYKKNGAYAEGGYGITAASAPPGEMGTLTGGMGKSLHKFMANYNHYISLLIGADNYHGGSVELDKHNRPVYHYDIAQGDCIAQFKNGIKRSTQILFAVGAKQVVVPAENNLYLNSIKDLHKIDDIRIKGSMFITGLLCGCTAQMGKDKTTSVLNSNCEFHEMENLFVVDGSMFPTSPQVPLSLLIAAVATKTSEYIVKAKS